jgi:hypothetical protein
MKCLDINNEQIEKLLIMCNDLFTDCDDTSISEDNLFVCFKKEDVMEKHHWFELCIMELPEKLAECSNTVYPKDKQYFIVDMMMKRMLNFSNLVNIHPIDYLYMTYDNLF